MKNNLPLALALIFAVVATGFAVVSKAWAAVICAGFASALLAYVLLT